ncbi:MAG: hypothetical protein WAM05_16255 [Candidatus Binataceae bacterium]
MKRSRTLIPGTRLARSDRINRSVLVEEDGPMSSTAKRLSLASALFGAAIWMGMTTLPAFVVSAHAQAISNQDSTATDASASDASDGADLESPDALPISVNGSWSGTISDDKMGGGDFTITFSQRRRKLNGGWTATFTALPQFLGDFRGKSTSTRVTFNLSSGQFNKRSCHIKFRSTSASGGQIIGTYRWADCGKEFKGNSGGVINITPIVTP